MKFWRKMRALGWKGMLNIWVFFCCFFWLMGAFTASGNVVLIENNVTLSFDDAEANFAPSVKAPGKCGTLYLAEPLDACSTLTNNIVQNPNDTKSPFVLMIRGGCDFDDKVRRAQAAGFKAAIVYDTEDEDLFTMYGNSAGIKIYTVFVSKASGEALAKYAGASDLELWIVPSFENSLGSILALSLAIAASIFTLVAGCLFILSYRARRDWLLDLHAPENHGMSGRLVTAMPTVAFTADLEDNSTSGTCAICLDDYNVGEKLRILPCSHKFHAICVDDWLTSWRTFCPICKRDARTTTGKPPASESTPLLSPTPSSLSATLSSLQPSVRSFSATQISRSPHCSSSISLQQSISGTTNDHHSCYSHNQPPHLTKSRSFVNLRQMSSKRSRGTKLVSPHSLGYPMVSSLNSRCVSPYIPSPGNALSGSVGTSSRQPSTMYYTDSFSSLSPFSSAKSLPEC